MRPVAHVVHLALVRGMVVLAQVDGLGVAAAPVAVVAHGLRLYPLARAPHFLLHARAIVVRDHHEEFEHLVLHPVLPLHRKDECSQGNILNFLFFLFLSQA